MCLLKVANSLKRVSLFLIPVMSNSGFLDGFSEISTWATYKQFALFRNSDRNIKKSGLKNNTAATRSPPPFAGLWTPMMSHAISEDAAPLDAKVQDEKITSKPRRVKRYELSDPSPERNMKA